MEAKRFIIACFAMEMCMQVVIGAGFDYSSSSGIGPNQWATKFADYCSKSSQSPININSSAATYKSMDAFTFTQYTTTGLMMDTDNNGHSYQITVNPNTFKVSKGGLVGTYILHSFHLHWGSDNTKGSEHTVNDKKYPAELHLVHYNDKYANLSDSLSHSDGLAVLGIFLEVGSENAALESFLKYAANVTEPNTGLKNLTQTGALNDILPANTSHFYRYSGSLTTPSCNEVVTWTVFKNAASISSAQLALLRNLKMTNTTMIVDNYRPVQALNGRVIKRTYQIGTGEEGTAPGPDNGAYHVTNLVEIAMALIMAALLKFFM